MKKNNKVLLDASAIIALIKKEKGYRAVDEVLAISAMSTVNFSEFIASLAREGIESHDIDIITENIIPEIIPFTREIAVIAGKLLPQTKHKGLSFGDRACIATAIYYESEVYTADKAWNDLDIPNVKIHLIR